MHSEAGWVQEPALRAIELPVGFYPVAVEIPKAVQAGPKTFDEGPLRDISIKVATEKDESQERGLSPRTLVAQRGGKYSRANWGDLQTCVGAEAVDQLKEVSQELHREWLRRIHPFAVFVRSRPLQFYARDDAMVDDLVYSGPAPVGIPEVDDEP